MAKTTLRTFDIKRGRLQTSGAVTATLDIPVPTGSIMTYEAFINLGDISDGAGGAAGGHMARIGAIKNAAETVALIGADTAFFTDILSGTLATATAVFTANATNLRLTVTGIAAIDIDWLYEIKTNIN